jgi:hypothetical protein
MRTTLSLDDDVAAAVQRLREERHVGLSEAVNELIRAGLAAPAPAKGLPAAHGEPWVADRRQQRG